jgi:hypothetical protein
LTILGLVRHDIRSLLAKIELSTDGNGCIKEKDGNGCKENDGNECIKEKTGMDVQLDEDVLSAFFWYLGKSPGGPRVKIQFQMKSTTGPAWKHREILKDTRKMPPTYLHPAVLRNG